MAVDVNANLLYKVLEGIYQTELDCDQRVIEDSHAIGVESYAVVGTVFVFILFFFLVVTFFVLVIFPLNDGILFSIFVGAVFPPVCIDRHPRLNVGVDLIARDFFVDVLLDAMLQVPHVVPKASVPNGTGIVGAHRLANVQYVASKVGE